MKSGVALAVLVAGMMAPALTQADDLFAMAWRGKAFSNGVNGTIVSRTITEQDFVRKVAVDNGLDPKSLIFVYRASKRDTAVVRRSDGAFIADVIQMEYSYTEVKNPSETAIVRQAFLFDENHDSAIGSAFGRERTTRNKNGDLTACSFSGTFQYAIPEDNTVYNGTFTTGARIKDTSGQ